MLYLLLCIAPIPSIRFVTTTFIVTGLTETKLRQQSLFHGPLKYDFVSLVTQPTMINVLQGPPFFMKSITNPLYCIYTHLYGHYSIYYFVIAVWGIGLKRKENSRMMRLCIGEWHPKPLHWNPLFRVYLQRRIIWLFMKHLEMIYFADVLWHTLQISSF